MSQSPPPPGYPPPPPPLPPFPPAPSYYSPAPPANGLAIASLVLGILAVTSLCCTCCMGCMTPVVAIPAIVLGHIALCQIRRPGSGQGGKEMAVGGLVTGYLALVIGILIAFAWLVIMLLSMVSSGHNIHVNMHHGMAM